MAEEEKREQDAPDEPNPEPEVYAVTKDLNGWQFDRRTFLAAAGAAVAAATVGTTAGCTPGSEAFQTVEAAIFVAATPSGSAAPQVVVVTSTPTDTPEVTDTPAPTDTPSPTDTSTPTETPSPTDTPTPALPKAQFVKDVTIPDGSVMKPGQKFTKTWRFKNVGAVSWGQGVKYVFVGGKQKGFESHKMGGPDAVDVANIAAGKTVDVSVDLVSPEKPGHYRSYWRLQLGNGEWLENVHYADIYVASQAAIKPGDKGIEFKVRIEGKWVTWTQPCGMPIPPGAVCVCNCVTATLPGKPGEAPQGTNAGTITGPGGETRWMPCGSPVPQGWTCSCNCVCSCDGVCSCVGHRICTCDAVHYWHPC